VNSDEKNVGNHAGYSYYEKVCTEEPDTVCTYDGPVNGAIAGFNIDVIMDYTVQQCKDACNDVPECKSFEYRTDTGRCSRNTVNSDEKNVGNYAGYSYYEKVCSNGDADDDADDDVDDNVDDDATDGDDDADDNVDDDGADDGSKDKDKKTKVLPPECLLPKAAGNCQGKKEPRYFFNPDKGSKGKCKKFKYTGCDGNANNFATKDECKAFCKYSKE